MTFTAPKPIPWNNVYKRLCEWRDVNAPAAVDEVPVPLILAGRIYSSSSQKHERWLATIAWATRHGCVQLATVAPDDMEIWDHDRPPERHEDYVR